MLYLLAILVPPVAVLLCGRPFSALLNLCLWPLCLVPAMVHAFMVVSEHKADRRTDQLVRAVGQSSR